MSQSQHIACPECGGVNRVSNDRLGDDPRCGRCKGRLFEGQPVSLNAETFDRVVTRTDIPVVVDFWAPWCGPCKMMAPAYEQAAAELEPQVRLAKLNTEEAPQVGARYGIQSIPTLVMFQNGKEVARQPGAMALPQITQWVRAHA